MKSKSSLEYSQLLMRYEEKMSRTAVRRQDENDSEFEDRPSYYHRKTQSKSKARKVKSFKQKKSKSPKVPKEKQHDFEKIIKLLPDAEELEGFVEQLELPENHATKRVLYEKLSRISTLLEQKTEKLETMDKFYIYRNGTREIELVRSMGTFFCNSSCSVRKTFGFMWDKKNNCLLMSTISGYSENMKPHEKILDSLLWKEKVLDFGKEAGLEVKLNGWDESTGHERGSGFASHVEVKLMLWWVHELLKGYEKPLKRLHKITKMKCEKNVEIFLTKYPCGQCLKWAREIEDRTELRFTFTVVKLLGNMASYINAKGEKTYRTSVTEPYEEHSTGSTIQIVIPSRPSSSTELTVSTHKRHQTLSPPISLARGYNSNTGKHTYFESDSEPDSESDSDPISQPPSTPVRKISTQVALSDRRTRAGLPTPDSAPFARDYIERAWARRAEKRKKEMESSPTFRKKRRQARD